ncbi:unnamed protein product [Ixodes hexagonus]
MTKRCLWQHSCPSWLPSPLSDIEWEIGSGILHTRDRLFRWRVVNAPRCAYCPADETSDHVMMSSYIARQLWARVSRTFELRVPVQYERERPGSGSQARWRTLLTTLGHHVLWKARCRAVHSSTPSAPVNILLHALCTRLRVFPEDELAALGETAFEATWCYRNLLRIRLGRLEMRGARLVDFR